MINYQKNNLGASSSPYLQQHKDNPVHWQEWGEEVLDHAKKSNALILVSIGYATCHWCHVMAAEAFSDPETADYLNKNFIPIKIDREQRPDIDEYFMSFMHSTNSQGGWPLNVVLSPEGHPFFGGTYFPVETKFGLRPFREVLEIINNWYLENKNSIREYEIAHVEGEYDEFDDSKIAEIIYPSFDTAHGGFGLQTKFPPHNTLLLLMNYFQGSQSGSAKEMILKTLDEMARGGLHDHLQGGLYRYCVDREWTIPHFEKMLYDQAMHLWVYSTAFKLFGRAEDEGVALKIVKCLRETFSDGSGLFYSAHDADTEYVEGATYVWSEKELKNILSDAEFKLFSSIYSITPGGNFEGKNHFVNKVRKSAAGENVERAKATAKNLSGDVTEVNKANQEINDLSSKNVALQAIEEKLLKVRKKRAQPFTDKKIITSWNALAGIGLLMASRYLASEKQEDLGSDKYLKKHEDLDNNEKLDNIEKNTDKKINKKMAVMVFDEIVKRHLRGGVLIHSSLDGTLQEQEFLEDHAALLLFATYLFEDAQEFGKTSGTAEENIYLQHIKDLLQGLEKFRLKKDGETSWFANKNDTDIQQIPAQAIDHPTPSAVSMAEMARFRAHKILGMDDIDLSYRNILRNDFYNLAAYFSRGKFHEVHSPERIPWHLLPINVLFFKCQKYQDCTGFSCNEYDGKEELLASFAHGSIQAAPDRTPD